MPCIKSEIDDSGMDLAWTWSKTLKKCTGSEALSWVTTGGLLGIVHSKNQFLLNSVKGYNVG